MTTTTTLTNLDHLIDCARILADRRADLARVCQTLNAQLEAAKADELPVIRAKSAAAAQAWQALEAGIQANPELFVKPRKVAAHGITFGIEKGKGSIGIPDAQRTVALIRKHLPDQAAVLIATEEVPVRKALAQLPAAELRRIGVTVEETGDQVVIRPAPSDVDKIVRAFIKADTE